MFKCQMIWSKITKKFSKRIYFSFDLVYFMTESSDAPLARTANDLHICMPSNNVKVLS